MGNYLDDEQITLINYIDKQLEKIMNIIPHDDYLIFINEDKYLSTYDNVLGYVDINYLPKFFLCGLTVHFLNKVVSVVDKKLSLLESK